jgi:thiol-disulfide isomerase/thioredoxin
MAEDDENMTGMEEEPEQGVDSQDSGAETDESDNGSDATAGGQESSESNETENEAKSARDDAHKKHSVKKQKEAGRRAGKVKMKKSSKKHDAHEKHAGRHTAKAEEKKRVTGERRGSGGKESKSETLRTWLFVILGVVLVANVIILANIFSTVGNKEKELQAAQVLPKVEIIELYNTACSKCFDISNTVTAVKNARVNVTGEKSVELDSDEGRQLASSYGITKAPTVIVTGETANLTLTDFSKSGDGLVFTAVEPPYTDVASGKVKGLVDVTYLKADGCDQCQDLNQLISQFESNGIVFDKKSEAGSSSAEGKALIAKYNITSVPTLLLSSELSEYSQIVQVWNSVGSVESDGTFIIRTPEALGIPFYDLSQDRLRGFVDVTYITDKSCATCYNVSVHRLILERFGVYPHTETTVDVSDAEGKALIAKYNITKVPTIILSQDASVYQALGQVWPTVGTVESDGMFVFRNPEAMTGSIYRDLSTGQIVGTTAAPTTAPATAPAGDVQVN